MFCALLLFFSLYLLFSFSSIIALQQDNPPESFASPVTSAVEDLSLRYDDIVQEYSFYRLEHPHSQELLKYIRDCHASYEECYQLSASGLANSSTLYKTTSLASKIANQHSALLITDQAMSLFHDIHLYIGNDNSKLSSKICHLLYSLSFALGEVKQVRKLLFVSFFADIFLF
jgi:hypothetical protein